MKPNIISPVRHMRFVIAGLTAVVLTACSSDSPVAPGDGAASMHVDASAVTATVLGESVAIQASVTRPSGTTITDAPIRWELSVPDVLESLGDGRFRVLKEGSVSVAAVWTKDPSVRASVSVNVNAGLLASACIARSDQSTASAARKCAQQRVVVRTSTDPRS